MPATVSIIVRGKVQGVFYRQSSREKALHVGITGRVMNHADGSVHILATGTPEQLDNFIAWCRQGPPKARVTDVSVEKVRLQNFDTFSIHRN
jgi:acylphosphatase